MRGEFFEKAIIAALFIAAVFFGWNWYLEQNIHKPISLNNVETVVLWENGILEGHQERKATDDEIWQIIEWLILQRIYGKMKILQAPLLMQGFGLISKQGDKLLFLIQGQISKCKKSRFGKSIGYWAKQRNIRKLLKDLRE